MHIQSNSVEDFIFLMFVGSFFEDKCIFNNYKAFKQNYNYGIPVRVSP